MTLIVEHAIKLNVNPVLNVPLSLNKGNLVIYKKRIGSITFTIVMKNQDLFVIYKILKILRIFTSTLDLMFAPLMLEKSLIMKVMNQLQKEGTSQIIIDLIQCMLTFYDINSKIIMVISSKTSVRGGGYFLGYKNNSR